MIAAESFTRRLSFCLVLAVSLVAVAHANSQSSQSSPGEKDNDSPLLRLMAEELDFSMKKLTTEDGGRPYYLCYTMTHATSAAVVGSLGAVEQNDFRTRRILDVDVRVGDYVLDNTRQIRGGAGDRFARRTDGRAPGAIAE